MASYDSYSDSYSGTGSGGSSFDGAFPRTPPVVRNLVILNVAIFILQLIVGKFTSFDYMRYFGLDSDLAVRKLWVWQFVTSTFLHSPNGIFHILMNMFVLWTFGREVEIRFGSRRFLAFYLMAGAFASLCFAVIAVLGATFELAVGASGAIMAVMVVFAILYPDAVLLAFFVVPVKAKHLVLFFIAVDLLYFLFLNESSQIAHSAHLGGALFGWLYLRYEPRLRSYLAHVEERERSKSKEDERVVRDQVDRLLDKIAAGEPITPKERKFLGHASRKYYGKEKSKENR